jgi:hypothetical protein
MIRALQVSDIEEIRKIHDKYFKHEFTFPDFFNGFLCSFAVTDDSDGSIIVAGGVRPIAEAYTLTNRDKSLIQCKSAMFQLFQAAAFVARAHEFDQLHAFVQSEIWEKRLQRHGFRPTKGKALVTDLG